MRPTATLGAALAVAAIALGAPAGPADAAGEFTLGLSPQSDAVVGRSMTIQATGTTPTEYLQFDYWLSVAWMPTSVATTCPSEQIEGLQFAEQNGGGVLVPGQRQLPDAAGSFSMPIAVTPNAPGSVLLCGYTDNNHGQTMARASLTLEIAAARSGQEVQRPGSVPQEVAKGIRLCRALFAPSKFKGCVRNLVKDANAACRKQVRSPRGQVRCLRRVRQVVRRDT
jgi:hypothetical protein